MIKVFQSIYEQDYNYIDDIRTWENEKQKRHKLSLNLQATSCEQHTATYKMQFTTHFTSINLQA